MFFSGADLSSRLKWPVPEPPSPLPLATAFWRAEDVPGTTLLGMVRVEGAVGLVELAGTTWSGRLACALVTCEGPRAASRAIRSRSWTLALAEAQLGQSARDVCRQTDWRTFEPVLGQELELVRIERLARLSCQLHFVG